MDSALVGRRGSARVAARTFADFSLFVKKKEEKEKKAAKEELQGVGRKEREGRKRGKDKSSPKVF